MLLPPLLLLLLLQVGVFGKVEQFQRELDRIAGLLDSDDEEAMGELVHGEQRHRGIGFVIIIIKLHQAIAIGPATA
jgi:hypothetical protein